MSPQHPLWGLKLRADVLNGWAITPRACVCIWGGVEGVYGPQSAPLFRRWCIATASECFEGHVHPNSPKNYIRLLGGLSPIHLMCRSRAKGLVWGARGPFPPAAAMVGYGCDGWCWPLEAYVTSTNCRNCKNCLWKYFFYSYVVPIHSWHLTRQLTKEDLDLHTLAFRCILCPVFYGSSKATNRPFLSVWSENAKN